MTSFLAGAAGALTILLALAVSAAIARRVFWRRFAHRPRFGLARLFRRVGTRPEQERAILTEVDALARDLAKVRGEAHAVRREVAALLDAPALDAARVSAVLDRPLSSLGEVRARAAEALSRIHALLDPEQRAALAALLAHPSHRGRCRGAHA